MNRPPWAVRQAIKNGGRLAILAEIDHPDGMVRVWSRTGTLEYAGFDWHGVGTLGRISGISGDKTVSVRPLTFELRGVPPDTVTFLETNTRNREARAWLAAIDKRADRVVGDRMLIAEGLCDATTLTVGDNRLATIKITVNQPIFVVDRAQNLAWTSESIKAKYGSEIAGLDFIPSLVNATENWTRE